MVLRGDASGGGVAGTLLGGAMELWALKGHEEGGVVLREVREEQLNADASVRRVGLKGKNVDYMSMEINEQMKLPRTRGREIKDGLDRDADDVLNAALGLR
jgi:hypothetical protein